MSSSPADRTDWREISLFVLLGTGIAVLVFTETLGLFSGLSRDALGLCWVGYGGLLAILAVGARGRLIPARPDWPNRASGVLVVAVVTVVLVVGVSAWFAPPNTVDSMNYHLSRVANWQQQHSVANYPSIYLPQLYQPPWAEFAVLNLQILSGSDRLANGVQWLSMIGTLIAISLIAKYLGQDGRGQLISTVFVAALPVGILEASGTQNDYVAAFWLTCLVAFALRARHGGVLNYLAAGMALGLALNTKGTNYIYAAPFVALLVFSTMKSLSKSTLLSLLLVAAIAVAINSGYYVRNYELFQSVLGPGIDEAGPSRYFVDEISPRVFASNLVRNLALHVGVRDSDVVNGIYRDVVNLHRLLGISENSPLTTWTGSMYHPVWLELHESRSGNFVALVVVLVSLLAASLSGLFKHDARLLAYVLAWSAGFLLFCALLRWQPWNSRLHLAWFVLAAPVVGTVWTRKVGTATLLLAVTVALLGVRAWLDSGDLSLRRAVVGLAALGLAMAVARLFRHRLSRITRWTAVPRVGQHAWVVLGFGLLIAALPWAAFNETRPLLGARSVLRVPRVDQYFANIPDLKAPYLWAAEQLRTGDCRRVGILGGPGAWDYPLWVLLHDDSDTWMLKNINVPNVSARLPSPAFVPCATVALRPVVGNELEIDGRRYVRLLDPSAPTSANQPVDLFLAQ